MNAVGVEAPHEVRVGGRVAVNVHIVSDDTIRATPQGSPEPGLVDVEVRDNGSGVAGAVREQLFEPHVTTKPHGSWACSSPRPSNSRA